MFPSVQGCGELILVRISSEQPRSSTNFFTRWVGKPLVVRSHVGRVFSAGSYWLHWIGAETMFFFIEGALSRRDPVSPESGQGSMTGF